LGFFEVDIAFEYRAGKVLDIVGSYKDQSAARPFANRSDLLYQSSDGLTADSQASSAPLFG